MSRPLAAWGIAFALGALGWLSAHTLACRIVPPAAEHDRHLHEAAHAYLAYSPLLIAFCLVLAVASLAVLVARAAGDRARPRLPAVLGVVPPLAFVVQEHAERLLSGAGALGTVAEPVFAVGLLLQVPFALAAVLVGRLLLAVADAIARRLGRAWAPRRLVAPRRVPRPRGTPLPSLALLPSGRGQRAPPLLLAL